VDFGGRPRFFATFFVTDFSAADVTADSVAVNLITRASSIPVFPLVSSRSGGFAASAPETVVGSILSKFAVIVLVFVVIVVDFIPAPVPAFAPELFSRDFVTPERLGCASQSKVTTSLEDRGAREEVEEGGAVAVASFPLRE